MNQEQNNFNTQGNNGIPNNQLLNNQIFNSTPQKKMNLGLIIGIIVAIVIMIIGVFILLSNYSKKNNETANNTTGENQQSNNNDTDSINYDELMRMNISINDNEIILNKTTIDEFLEMSKWTNYEESDFSTEVNKSIVLKDGINEITLTYLKSNHIIFQITTNENFDSSITKIQYQDSYIGTLNIGDTISKETLREKYTINKNNYHFYLNRNVDEDLIILYKSNEPIVMNYLYHDVNNNLTGFSAWWYIY